MLRPHRAPAEVDRVGLCGGTHSDERRDLVQNRAQPVRKVGREVDVVLEHERNIGLCCHQRPHSHVRQRAPNLAPLELAVKEAEASAGELPARVRGGAEAREFSGVQLAAIDGLEDAHAR